MEPIQIGELINRLIILDDTPATDKTMMSIAGISHLENIWSNIYAYYLDERESHGLGALFQKSLERIIQRKTGKPVSLFNSIIKREYATIGGNRIDLLIQAPDCSVIIENKVHHQLDNDLSDYWISVPGNNETKVGIVLTLSPIKISFPNFINVTHLEWIREIELQRLLSDGSMNSKAMMLLDDFIANIKKVSLSMDTTNINFYLDNREQINKLYSEVTEYRIWLQSVFTDRAFIRSLVDLVLVHNDWIGSKHRFAMYRVLDGKNGELVITVFYEWLWNSSPGNARLCLYLQPIGDWFEIAKDNKTAICSISNANGVPSMDINKDFWHCASVMIPVPESHLLNDLELKKYLIKHIGDHNSGLMRTARSVGELLSKTHIPSYQWEDAVAKFLETVAEREDIDATFIISQINFKYFEPSTQIVILEVTDNIIRNYIEHYIARDLLRAIRYVYGNNVQYTILCRQFMI